MICKTFLFFCLLLQVVSSPAQKKDKPVAVIFDSDMGPDYDDVGAIAMLHAFADRGYAKILATVASTKYEGVAAIFNVFNTYFERPDLAIGVPKGKALELKDVQHWTDTLLLKYPHSIKKNDEVPGATEVYRKVLASQPDKSVTIITVGFLTNLSNLLQSPPDKYSRLNGKDLVRRKVLRLVSMAGRFPAGSEFNVNRDAAASQVVFNSWPTPVWLSGFEIGQKVKVGLPLIHNESINNSPVKDVFRVCIPLSQEDSAGRMSWDETAVLVAIKGISPWYTLEGGKMIVAEDGSNTWTKLQMSKKPQPHDKLKEVQSPAIVEQLINTLIMHQPVKK